MISGIVCSVFTLAFWLSTAIYAAIVSLMLYANQFRTPIITSFFGLFGIAIVIMFEILFQGNCRQGFFAGWAWDVTTLLKVLTLSVPDSTPMGANRFGLPQVFACLIAATGLLVKPRQAAQT